MASNDRLDNVQRTRTGRLWLMLVPTLVFLILLIIFIAENGQRVELKFLGASGQVSLALALLVAAVGGAVIVLLIGAARIVQLRVATMRHRRADKRAGSATSAAVAPGGDAQPVETQGDTDTARP